LTVTRSDYECRQLVASVDAALAKVDELEGSSGAVAVDAVQALVDLYGEALERIMIHVTQSPPRDLPARLTTDELIGHMLIAHGLAPASPDLITPAPSSSVPVTFHGTKPAAAHSS
jgi:hypothetical protein